MNNELGNGKQFTEIVEGGTCTSYVAKVCMEIFLLLFTE